MSELLRDELVFFQVKVPASHNPRSSGCGGFTPTRWKSKQPFVCQLSDAYAAWVLFCSNNSKRRSSRWKVSEMLLSRTAASSAGRYSNIASSPCIGTSSGACGFLHEMDAFLRSVAKSLQRSEMFCDELVFVQVKVPASHNPSSGTVGGWRIQCIQNAQVISKLSRLSGHLQGDSKSEKLFECIALPIAKNTPSTFSSSS